MEPDHVFLKGRTVHQLGLRAAERSFVDGKDFANHFRVAAVENRVRIGPNQAERCLVESKERHTPQRRHVEVEAARAGGGEERREPGLLRLGGVTAEVHDFERQRS